MFRSKSVPQNSVFFSAIIWLLIFQIGFGYSIVSFATTTPHSHTTPVAPTLDEIVRHGLPDSLLTNGTIDADTQLIADAVGNPVLAKIYEHKTELQALSRALAVPQGSPLLDANPYFLRSQSWENATPIASEDEDNEEVSETVEASGRSTLLNLPENHRALRITAPLRLLFSTSDYVFFAAKDDSIFRAKTPDAERPGEGVFFVSQSELLAASLSGRAVPFFFLPLDGNGWSEAAHPSMQEIAHRDTLIFIRGDNDRTPVRLEHLRILERGARMNYESARSIAAVLEISREHPNDLPELLMNATREAAAQGRNGMPSLQSLLSNNDEAEVLPLPNSTAGFGILLTDIIDTSSSHANVNKNLLKNFWSQTFGISNAHADDSAIAQTIAGSLWIAKVMGAYIGVSALLDIFVIKNRIQADGESPTHPATIFTTLTQLLTVSFQSAYYVNFLGIRYFSDRFLPHAARENSLVSKVINTAFGRAMSNYSSLTTVWRDLISGVIVLGLLADSSAVTFEGLWLNTQVWNAIGNHIPFLTERARHAVESPNVAALVIGSILGGFAQWGIVGSYNVQGESIMGIEASERPVVQREMLAEKLDPGIHVEEFERRLKERVDADKKRKNILPTYKMWLNIDRMVNGIHQFLGYRPAQVAADKDIEPKNFLRTGLVRPAIDETLREARIALRNEPSNTALAGAVQILEGLAQDVGVLGAFVNFAVGIGANPRIAGETLRSRMATNLRNAAGRLKKVKAEVSPLLLAAQAQDPIVITPQSWVEASAEGGPLAADLLYKKLKNHLNSATVVAQPTSEPQTSGSIDPLETEGFFAKWQLRRALNRAGRKLIAFTQRGNGFSATREETDRIIQQEILKASGIYPEYANEELIKIVEGRVAREWKERLEGRQAAAPTPTGGTAVTEQTAPTPTEETAVTEQTAPTPTAYAQQLARLSPADQMRIGRIVRADMFARHYRAATITENLVPLGLNPANPGNLQWLRQTRVVRNSKVLTGIMRVVEAHYSRDNYERGLYAKVVRDFIPLLHHSRVGITKAFVPLATVITTQYWIMKNVWHATPPLATLIFFSLVFYGPTVKGGWLTTNQIFDNLGIPIRKNLKTIFFYGAVGAHIYTWTGPIYYGLISREAHIAENYINQGINLLQTAAPFGLAAIAAWRLGRVAVNTVKDGTLAERVRNAWANRDKQGFFRTLFASRIERAEAFARDCNKHLTAAAEAVAPETPTASL